ncbi:hypothetical protein EH183_24695 [Streptomyces sp. CB01881]|nr:hypothetical protein C2142_24705 [Streptomyces sp. CB01881]TYC74996.1 hypothetical protein EH183_24695 [Streptomyces sp. CB01881]
MRDIGTERSRFRRVVPVRPDRSGIAPAAAGPGVRPGVRPGGTGVRSRGRGRVPGAGGAAIPGLPGCPEGPRPAAPGRGRRAGGG